jgi:hypothetical protein
METPNSDAGRETDAVMMAIVEGHHGSYTTAAYNRAWSALLALLEEIERQEGGSK